MTEDLNFLGVPIIKNDDLAEALAYAHQACNVKAEDEKPGCMWVGADFMSRYLTYSTGRETNRDEALAWLTRNAVYDDEMGLWRVDTP